MMRSNMGKEEPKVVELTDEQKEEQRILERINHILNEEKRMLVADIVAVDIPGANPVYQTRIMLVPATEKEKKDSGIIT